MERATLNLQIDPLVVEYGFFRERERHQLLKFAMIVKPISARPK